MITERRRIVNSALHYPTFSNCMRQNYPPTYYNSLVKQEIVGNVTCKKRELQYDIYFDKHVATEVD